MMIEEISTHRIIPLEVYPFSNHLLIRSTIGLVSISWLVNELVPNTRGMLVTPREFQRIKLELS